MAVTITSRAGESVSVDIPFHKHCQKTILAASGIPSGNGATWSKISDLSEKLNYFPENWLEKYFMSNHNITEDLASILELINGVYGKISEISPIKQVIFHDVDDNIIGTYLPDQNGQISPKLGKKINLSIEGESISFSTLTGAGYDDSGEITNITLPKHTLQVISGGSTVDSVGVVMENDFDISIPLDSNLVHRNGDETIDGDKTFTGTTRLSTSPLDNASGHEVVDAAWVKNMCLEMFNQIYPVGSIYLDANNFDTCPMELVIIGSVWQKLGSNKLLAGDSKAPVIGNGTAIGLTNGTDDGVMNISSGDKNSIGLAVTNLKVNVGQSTEDYSSPSINYRAGGLTTDPDRSGMVADIGSANGVMVNIWKRIA